jgi:CelD/BcsL family acetyltransferase involved in cellulose biosynthesis
MRWKSAQWRTTGSIDHFAADPCYVQLFREVKRRWLLALPTLSAGQTLLSIHIGAMWLDWWVPAYDPELARYPPVRLLPETFLADSFARGHAEFDFLVGDNITSGITRRITEKSARWASPPWPFFCAMRR